MVYAPRRLSAVAIIMALMASAAVHAQSGNGPDVIVGALPSSISYGSVGQIAAFSVGTTSCNIGNSNLSWISGTNAHPVIGQNLYRLSDGRIEQIGMSWLKHGFLALTQNLCGTCSGQGGSVLGVGCSDPYGASLNGSQSPLGARSEVNAATGVFPFPRQHTPNYPPVIGRRIQVHHADLDPALNPGAKYFVEAQYVTQDDAAAGNNNNNASYREATFSPSGSGYSMTLTGTTQMTKSGVTAWADNDISVVLQHVDIPGDGRVTIAQSVVPLPGGNMRVTYAIHNLNSDRSISGVSVDQAPGFNASNDGFHDVEYHSSEVYNSIDWTYSVASNGVSWQSTQGYALNPNANALRWGSTYTFWFDTDTPPGSITLDLFKPGATSTITVPPITIPSPDWQINSPEAHLDIDGEFNNAFQGPITISKFIAEPGIVNFSSTLSGNPYDIAITAAPAVPLFFTTAGSQIVNIDLTTTVFWLNGFFLQNMPAAPISIPFSSPGGTAAMQMVLVDPTSSDGLALSAAVQLTGTAAPPPVIGLPNPASAIAGGTVSLPGAGFIQGAAVTIGGVPVPTTYVSDLMLTFFYPQNVACDSPLVMTNPDNQTASGVLNPTPAINNPLSPSGPAAGGQTFVVVGSGFAPGTTVDFNGVPATVSTAAYSIMIVTVPAGSPGVVQVTYNTPGGCTVTTPYTYQ